MLLHALACMQCPVSVLGLGKGYKIKYGPLSEGVPEGKAQDLY